MGHLWHAKADRGEYNPNQLLYFLVNLDKWSYDHEKGNVKGFWGIWIKGAEGYYRSLWQILA